MTSVLFVISAADEWTLNDGSKHPTGYWAEEVAVPHRIFSEAGWDITIATPGGQAPTMDELSVGLAGGLPGKRKEIVAYLDTISSALNRPEELEKTHADEYDLVFYPGGHGPMEDLAQDATSGALLTRRLQNGTPLALLCHAPAAVLAAGEPSPFAGRTMTGLSNAEEKVNAFARKAKWLLEDELKRVGVNYTKAALPYRPHIEVDGNLYTGQNPQSSEKLAERLVADLSR
ncbi:type 1 glutamine amidotransferase domain-containing protein [Corynebacterium incognita]|uniref:Type 1 glutamine amidotransferase domain-containing protein n=1 Tax=Corynebacterium incognita TaxID=2754725 RepID=A0A7G7CN27_9CORY|nr:type 1 glutamine amidotransferase domain-containing protein [Corynebacterium incognita]QNE88993.1 type 1 glutamine amidotransferase domain-containing protein [Corynebacterium incognita]